MTGSRVRVDVPRIVSGGRGSSWWLVVPTGQPSGRRHAWQRYATWRAALDGLAQWYARRAA